MTVAEEALCTSNEIEFGEIVLGYSAVAFIANPALDFLDCVTTNELSTVLAPSSIQNTTWSAALGITDQETEIEAYLPSADELTYFLADEILAGAGFRSDINTLDTEADILTEVAEANGGIGIVGLGSLIDTDDVMIVEIRNNTIGQCVAPTAESVGDGSYIAGTPLLMYVNTDVLSSSDELAAVATYVSDPASSDVLTASGFAPPTDFDYETNLEIASGVSAGRQFSRSLTEFQIPPTVAGTVNISGAAGAFPLLDTVASQFTQVYQGATINVNTLGEPAGLRALCNGETDIVATYGTISEQTLTNCEAADITVVDIQIGEQATVLVASESAEHLTCMTTEELVGVWGADATDTITTWVDVNEEYPDSPFFLFAGDPNNAIPNLMMRQAAGRPSPCAQTQKLTQTHSIEQQRQPTQTHH
jgi:ABC-type phosphate transport system substrate-binding protein